MSDTLEVTSREKLGSRNSHALRCEGNLPAVLYGHKEASVNLTVPAAQVRKVIDHGGKIVQLQGAASGQALLQEVQWDTFGISLVHVDLLRVSAGEMVTVEVPVELRGEAPGEKAGGVVSQVRYSVEIESPPAAIPEKLTADISKLEIGDTYTIEAIGDLPEKAKFLTELDRVLVNCVPAAGEPEETEEAAAGEPEVLSKGGGDEEASE